MNANQSRRDFLKTIHSLPFAVPVLPSLLGSSGASAAGTPLKRLVIFYVGNGVHLDIWNPKVNMAQMATSESDGSKSVLFSDVRKANNGVVTECISPEMAKFSDHLLLLQGFNMTIQKGVGGHPAKYDYVLFNKGGNTIDQFINMQKQVNPGGAPAVLLYGNANGAQSMHFQNGNKQGVSKNGMIYFNELLSNVSGTTVSQPTPSPAIQQPPVPSVESVNYGLALANEKFKSMSKSRLLSADDLKRLQEHQTLLNDYPGASAQALAGGPSEEPPAMVQPPPTSNVRCSKPQVSAGGDHQQLMRSHVDLMAALIKCNRAHVFACHFFTGGAGGGGTDDDYKYSFLGTQDRMHFEFSHRTYDLDKPDPSKAANGRRLLGLWAKIFRWQTDQIARLMVQLNVEESNGRTFLDNTLILLTSSQGATRGNHQYGNRMVLFAGGGSYFRTGRFVSYPSQGDVPVASEIAKAFGVSGGYGGNAQGLPALRKV